MKSILYLHLEKNHLKIKFCIGIKQIQIKLEGFIHLIGYFKICNSYKINEDKVESIWNVHFAKNVIINYYNAT